LKRGIKASPAAKKTSQRSRYRPVPYKGDRTRREDCRRGCQRLYRIPQRKGYHSTPPVSTPVVEVTPLSKEEPISSVRREIASKLSKSYREAVHITLEFSADVTGIVKIRERLKEKAEKNKLPVPTFNDIFVRIVSLVLKDLTQP